MKLIIINSRVFETKPVYIAFECAVKLHTYIRCQIILVYLILLAIRFWNAMHTTYTFYVQCKIVAHAFFHWSILYAFGVWTLSSAFVIMLCVVSSCLSNYWTWSLREYKFIFKLNPYEMWTTYVYCNLWAKSTKIL